MRRAVSDGQPIYRVVVASYKRKPNPDYVQGSVRQYWVLTDEITETAYGPYNNLGTAKGILTRETIDTWKDGQLKWGVVGGRVEKANTVWEEVDLGGGQV